MQPSPDQDQFVEDVRDARRQGYQSVLGVAPTGFGKSFIAAYLAWLASLKRNSVWFCVHRKTLIHQVSREFWKMHVEHGLIQGGKSRTNTLIQVASIDTIRSRMDRLTPPKFAIIDEAHMASSNTWSRIIDWMREHGTFILGTSATPTRLDNKPLSDQFDTMVEGPSVRWLIDNGRLSDYRLYAPAEPVDTSGLHVRSGEYITAESEALMDKPKIIGDAIQHYRRYADGKRAVCYCVSIRHSLHVTAQFNAAGIPAAHIDGTTNQRDRQRIIEDFGNGTVRVLCNVELITTGFDLSAQVGREVPIEACILLRPTQSLALLLQMIGRTLRRKPEPAIILDHVGGCFRHGLPDDDRQWSLAGRRTQPQSDDEDAVQIKQCPQCFGIYRLAARCPYCHAQTPVQSRDGPEQVDGELAEVEKARERRERRREQGAARTIEELVDLGVRRGMRHPDKWAVHVYMGRFGRKPGPAHFEQAQRALKQAKEMA